MDKETFTKYLNDFSLLNSETLPEIKAMLDEYPYFQSAWILYIKNLHAIKDIRYESKLKNASAYISDRKILQNILKGTYTPSCQTTKATENVLEISATEITTADETAQPETQTETISNVSIHNENAETESISDIISTDNQPIAEEIQAETSKENVENSENEISAEAMPVTEESTPETSIEAPTEQTEQETQELVETDTDENITSEDISDPTETQQAQIKELIEKQLLALGIKSTITFGKGNANIQFENISNISNDSDKAKDKHADSIEATNEHANISVSSKERKKNLIDNFLKSETKITPIDNYHSDSTLTIDSLIEDEELFSEKLARIYIKQKHYEKALATYEKLYLKYPEKNIYFATQIEYVKRLINK